MAYRISNDPNKVSLPENNYFRTAIVDDDGSPICVLFGPMSQSVALAAIENFNSGSFVWEGWTGRCLANECGTNSHKDMMREVSTLRPGDMIDLEGDKYVDPNSTNVGLQYEYYIVEEMKETKINPESGWPEEVVLYSSRNGGNYAFPPSHKVKYLGHDPEYDLDDSL